MARHTFVVSGGLRVEIQQSASEPGSVLLTITEKGSGCGKGWANIPASTAAVIAQALQLEAAAAESLAESTRIARGLGASVSGARGEPIKVRPHPSAQGLRGSFLQDDRANHGSAMDAPCWIPTGGARGYRNPPVERPYDVAHQLRVGA